MAALLLFLPRIWKPELPDVEVGIPSPVVFQPLTANALFDVLDHFYFRRAFCSFLKIITDGPQQHVRDLQQVFCFGNTWFQIANKVLRCTLP